MEGKIILNGKKTLGSIAYMGGVMNVPEPFLRCWQQMIEYNYEYLLNPNERIDYNRSTVSYHSFARNTLVSQMQGDWLLQLDTDITFEPDLLGRMLNRMDKFNIDILVGMYLYKNPPHPPVLYGYDKQKKSKFVFGDWQVDADLIPIKGAGAGCLLVRKSVFDKLTNPFDIILADDKVPLSEDHSFFERCWELGIKAYAAPDIYVKHLIYKELDPYKDYNKTGLNIQKIDNF